MSTSESFTASCSACSLEVNAEHTSEVFDIQSVHQREQDDAHVLEFDRLER